jgi:hypothetical protein
MKALGAGARPQVAVSINGHSWRSRVAAMRGRSLVGISAANRAGCGIDAGDMVEVELQLDTAPRVVPLPADLAAALDDAPGARAAFDRLPYGVKRRHVADIEGAKASATRERRIAKLVATVAKTSPRR